MQVSHDTSASWSRLKPHGDRYVALFLWRRIKSKKYQFIMVPLVTIPFLMMICLYQSTYGRPYMIWYDCVFTVLYLIEYLARVVIMGKFLYRPTGWTELGIGLFLLSFLFWVAVYGTDDTYASLGVRVCVIARCFRLMHTYPQYMVIWRTLVMGLSGVVPTLAYLIVFVLIYAVIGNVVLGDIQPAWDDPFLYTRYNFTNYVNAFITLMAMGSGNMWTEMLVKLQDGQEWYLQVFIEFYLVTYYLVVTIIVRSFALMIISKYLTQGGLDLGLAGQQLRRFRRSWSAVNGSNTSMDISKLFDFICTLKYPLGTKSNKFVLVERFLKRVLLCMPADSEHLDDSDNKIAEETLNAGKVLPPKLKARSIYTEEYLNIHMWNLEDKFTFRQVLLATHRNFIEPPKLSDDRDFEESRAKARYLIRSMSHKLGHMVILGTTTQDEISRNENIMALRS